MNQFLGDQSDRIVTLPMSEVQWMALSEAVKEVMFLIQFLRSMEVSVKITVVVRIDSVGAMIIAGSNLAARHTKHGDISYMVMSMWKMEMLEIIF